MQNIFTRVLIKDEDHHILVVQDRGDLWNFPGGKQEIGETPSECAKREVKEEIGLTVHVLTEVYQGNFFFSDTRWTGYFYFADSVSGVPCMNELKKIKGIRFVNDAGKVNFPDELSVIYDGLFKDDLILGKTTNWFDINNTAFIQD
ncbi:8-oxo-dGTP diphosphatase [Cytobacillus firmus]|uniref:8-oxo-dGTP diphosphatase n=2 Tax=Cytobacillus TaxID=2675230 RepID=A0A366JJP7_CYTFI|nr:MULTISPECIES: NUDIX hydrolase [Cytobacillus]RBP86861.1 8-oxo-dGTP diphosphatase [Cytobacillus firmus]TDX36514.1 8-oxo-dGTP diphosphatase [Cytobacillus oceanisediminis]